MTEFGKTPYISVYEFETLGVRMVIFPLTAFRRMMKSAEEVYRIIKKEGTQKSILNHLQTREELYKLLNYYELIKNEKCFIIADIKRNKIKNCKELRCQQH